jgi:hypothetical protein
VNGLSARERRLLVILGGVLVIMVGVFLLGRGGGSAEGVPDLVFPTPSVTASTPAPSATPSFVVPSGARDPFGNS